MTLLERPTEAPVRMECLHDARGVCWLCSDKDPRWRAWRGGGEPPNRVVRAEPLLPETVLIEVPCIRCGQDVLWPEDGQTQPRHAGCKPRRIDARSGWSMSGWREWYQKTYGRAVAS